MTSWLLGAPPKSRGYDLIVARECTVITWYKSRSYDIMITRVVTYDVFEFLLLGGPGILLSSTRIYTEKHSNILAQLKLKMMLREKII